MIKFFVISVVKNEVSLAILPIFDGSDSSLKNDKVQKSGIASKIFQEWKNKIANFLLTLRIINWFLRTIINILF